MLAAAVAGYRRLLDDRRPGPRPGNRPQHADAGRPRDLPRLARDPGRRARRTGPCRSACRSSPTSSWPAGRSSAATSPTSWATWSIATPGGRRARSGSRSRSARSPRARWSRPGSGVQDLVLIRTGETILALHNQCAHAGGPLNEGTLVDGCVECPWHGSRFEVATGRRRRGPTVYDQPTYEVRADRCRRLRGSPDAPERRELAGGAGQGRGSLGRRRAGRVGGPGEVGRLEAAPAASAVIAS